MARSKAKWPKKGDSNSTWYDRTAEVSKAARAAERIRQKRAKS